jgi:DNA-binding Lrp family transcriptional regulator
MQFFGMALSFSLGVFFFQYLSDCSIIWIRLRKPLCKTIESGAGMDDADLLLIAELRRDGRASLSDLAARLGMSRATVRVRMEKLQNRGEIAGFTVMTRGDVTASPVRALMMIGIEGRGAEKIMARLTGIPAILAVHSTNGKWDLIAELGAATLLELDDVINRVRGLDGVMTSETNLLLSTRRAGRRAVA